MLVQNRKGFEFARTVMLEAEVIGIDTETTGLYPHEGDEMCGFSIYTELPGREMEYGAYLPFRHKPGESLFDSSENLPLEWLKELAPCFERTDCTYVFHHGKFDRGFFRKDGLEFHGKIYDTKIIAHMLNENESSSLDEVGFRYLKERKVSDISVKKGAHIHAPKTIEPYAVQDARLTYKLLPVLWEELEEQGMAHLWEDEESFLNTLFEMEWYGIRIDRDLAHSLSVKTQERMRVIETELGFDPLKLNKLAEKLFLSPPEGLGFIPGPLTKEKTESFPNGRPVMDEAQLLTYSGPVIDLVLEYRGLVKANSTWYEGFERMSKADGRIHPTFNQHGTRTSRLSCSNPNMQQIPRNVEDTPAKRLLIPSDGFELWEFDYSQIEFRLGTIYSKEEAMLEAFKRGEDVYQLTADRLGITRFQGKTINLGTIYGLGANTLAESLDIPYDYAKSLLNEFHSQFPGYRNVAQAAEQTASSKGYVKLWTGRRRHFTGENYDYHKAFNSICQGGAAEIVKQSMLLFSREPDPENRRMVMQVHDSLVFEIREGRDSEAIRAQIKNMIEWPTEHFGLPFPVEQKRIN